MKNKAVVLFMLLVAFIPAVAGIIKYFENGGKMVLIPNPVSDRITEILWKHRGDLLVDWVEGDTEMFYSKFKGRSNLTTSTGVLEISNLDESYTGNYEVQINHKVQKDTYEAVMIKKVPAPEVRLQPLACGQHLGSCSLKCDGDITGAKPVIYHWKMGDREWMKGQEDQNIVNNESTWSLKTFSCKIENPISTKESKPVDNPFFKENPDVPGPTVNVAGIVGGIFAVLLVVILVFVVIKFKVRIMERISALLRENRTSANESGSQSRIQEATPLADTKNGAACSKDEEGKSPEDNPASSEDR